MQARVQVYKSCSQGPGQYGLGSVQCASLMPDARPYNYTSSRHPQSSLCFSHVNITGQNEVQLQSMLCAFLRQSMSVEVDLKLPSCVLFFTVWPWVCNNFRLRSSGSSLLRCYAESFATVLLVVCFLHMFMHVCPTHKTAKRLTADLQC